MTPGIIGQPGAYVAHISTTIAPHVQIHSDVCKRQRIGFKQILATLINGERLVKIDDPGATPVGFRTRP